MPRPTTKKELLETSQANYQKLITLIDGLSKTQLHAEFPEGTLNRNVRDVLAHLHHWNLMTLEWYRVGMSGEKPSMPAEGYTWKTLPALNKAIQKEYAKQSLKKVRELFNDSFQQLQAHIQKHSNKELFEKKRYAWTGSTSMGSYFVSAASSHYVWGYKLIKKNT